MKKEKIKLTDLCHHDPYWSGNFSSRIDYFEMKILPESTYYAKELEHLGNLVSEFL